MSAPSSGSERVLLDALKMTSTCLLISQLAQISLKIFQDDIEFLAPLTARAGWFKVHTYLGEAKSMGARSTPNTMKFSVLGSASISFTSLNANKTRLKIHRIIAFIDRFSDYFSTPMHSTAKRFEFGIEMLSGIEVFSFFKVLS
jgi:hypothetical protein